MAVLPVVPAVLRTVWPLFPTAVLFPVVPVALLTWVDELVLPVVPVALLTWVDEPVLPLVPVALLTWEEVLVPLFLWVVLPVLFLWTLLVFPVALLTWVEELFPEFLSVLLDVEFVLRLVCESALPEETAHTATTSAQDAISLVKFLILIVILIFIKIVFFRKFPKVVFVLCPPGQNVLHFQSLRKLPSDIICATDFVEHGIIPFDRERIP